MLISFVLKFRYITARFFSDFPPSKYFVTIRLYHFEVSLHYRSFCLICLVRGTASQCTYTILKFHFITALCVWFVSFVVRRHNALGPLLVGDVRSGQHSRARAQYASDAAHRDSGQSQRSEGLAGVLRVGALNYIVFVRNRRMYLSFDSVHVFAVLLHLCSRNQFSLYIFAWLA